MPSFFTPPLVDVTTRYIFTIAPRDLISSFLHDHESLNMFSLTLPASTVTEINQMWLRLKCLAVPMEIVCLICACAILSESGLSPWVAYTMYLTMPFFCVWTGVMLGRLNIKVVKRVFQTFNFWFTMTQVRSFSPFYFLATLMNLNCIVFHFRLLAILCLDSIFIPRWLKSLLFLCVV